MVWCHESLLPAQLQSPPGPNDGKTCGGRRCDQVESMRRNNRCRKTSTAASGPNDRPPNRSRRSTRRDSRSRTPTGDDERVVVEPLGGTPHRHLRGLARTELDWAVDLFAVPGSCRGSRT
jgi:hypothetical protein